MSSIERVVEQGDLDGLVRLVDRLCDASDWDGLVELRDRCRWALERGKQLWPAASLAEYRLALEAPGEWAAATIVEGAGRFALGPLPEVAASTHLWSELAPHLQAGPLAAITGHERVVRGEDLSADASIDRAVLEVPLALCSWEPAYPVAEYHADKAEFPGPPDVELASMPLSPASVRTVEDASTLDALLGLTARWTTESNGRADAVAVQGDAAAAIAALGVRRARGALIDGGTAMAHMAWAAASGGAHGRRRGMASGRFDAWWAVTALAGGLDDWPLTGEEVGEITSSLRWWLWDAYEPKTGWWLRLAVEDPDEGLAWAIAATDGA